MFKIFKFVLNFSKLTNFNLFSFVQKFRYAVKIIFMLKVIVLNFAHLRRSDYSIQQTRPFPAILMENGCALNAVCKLFTKFGYL